MLQHEYYESPLVIPSSISTCASVPPYCDICAGSSLFTLGYHTTSPIISQVYAYRSRDILGQSYSIEVLTAGGRSFGYITHPTPLREHMIDIQGGIFPPFLRDTSSFRVVIGPYTSFRAPILISPPPVLRAATFTSLSIIIDTVSTEVMCLPILYTNRYKWSVRMYSRYISWYTSCT